MAKSPLRDSVKNYYQQQVLNKKQLDALVSLQKGKTAEKKDKRLLPWVGVAAAIFISVISVTFYFSMPSDTNLPYRIAQEVAEDHVKMKPLDMETARIDELKRYFTQLDFALIQSAGIEDETLLGGRYCSIFGVTAAQLRYLDFNRDNKVTLYQVEYDVKTFGELPNVGEGKPPIEVLIKGLSVTIWVEKGLLLAKITEN